MSRIQVRLASIELLQGLDDEASDVQVEVRDSAHTLLWPPPGTAAKINPTESALLINEEVATYDIESRLSTAYNVFVTLADGNNTDYGSGSILLELTPSTTGIARTVLIDLKRPKMKTNGQLKVTMAAVKL